MSKRHASTEKLWHQWSVSSPISTIASPVTVERILTHPGGAHKDEFLACCALISRYQVPVVRREPTEEELKDPAVVVVDVGGEHTPEHRNFDHHQFHRDHAPRCALSLVLSDLGLYDAALGFCDWLETAEWLDCRGPIDTARHLQVDTSIIHKLASPVDFSLLRRFSVTSELHPNNPLWQIMGMVGEDLLGYIEGMKRRLEEIEIQAEWWTVEGPHGSFEVLFLERGDSMPSEPSAGLGRYIEQQGKTDSVVAMVYPDRRGSGYGLSRFNDSPTHDFSRIEDCDDVHFAHARGFVAKSSATDPARLRELLALAQVAAG